MTRSVCNKFHCMHFFYEYSFTPSNVVFFLLGKRFFAKIQLRTM